MVKNLKEILKMIKNMKEMVLFIMKKKIFMKDKLKNVKKKWKGKMNYNNGDKYDGEWGVIKEKEKVKWLIIMKINMMENGKIM